MTTKANPPRKSQATVALLDAYNRLRDGKGTATNGKLSITTVSYTHLTLPTICSV